MEVVEKRGFDRVLVDPYLEKEDNNTFLNQCSSKKLFSKKEYSSNKKKCDANNKDSND